MKNARVAQGWSTTLPRLGSRVRVPFFALSQEDARVVESVDTQDLKSCGHCGRAGSIPASSTNINLYNCKTTVNTVVLLYFDPSPIFGIFIKNSNICSNIHSNKKIWKSAFH